MDRRRGSTVLLFLLIGLLGAGLLGTQVQLRDTRHRLSQAEAEVRDASESAEDAHSTADDAAATADKAATVAVSAYQQAGDVNSNLEYFSNCVNDSLDAVAERDFDYVGGC